MDEVSEIMEAMWKRIDTMVIGRKTWDVSQKMGGGPEMPGITTFLCSRTLASVPKDVQISNDAVRLVQDLKVLIYRVKR